MKSTFHWLFLIPILLILLIGSVRYTNWDDSVTAFYLYANDSDLERLWSRDVRSDDRIRGFGRWENERRNEQLRGFRFRGNTSRHHPKKSYNIRFEHPQRILFNADRLNWNALYTDPSGMRERLAWGLFHDVGHPASQTRYVALYINDSYEGLGLSVQRIDETLLRNNRLNANGTLVRDLTRRRVEERNSIFGYDISQENDPVAYVADMFTFRGNPNWSAVAELVQWAHDTPAGEVFAREFPKKFELENFIDWLALHYLFADVDAYGDDYWLYRNTRSRRSKWMIIPWDHDLSFGKNERDNVPVHPELGQFGDGIVQLHDYFAYEYPIDDGGWGNALISKFLETDVLREKLHHRLEVLMQEIFPPSYFECRISEISSEISEYMTREPSADEFKIHNQQHHGALGFWEYHKENIQDFIWLRYAFLDRALNPIEGELYTASVQLSLSGERHMLTDASGWTIAWFTPDNDISEEITLSISSEAHEADGINQRWRVNTSAPVSGTLSLFYRNDIAPDGKENWFVTEDAVGRQWDLNIHQPNRENSTQITEIHRNPFSNKIEGRVSLNGEQEFFVVF